MKILLKLTDLIVFVLLDLFGAHLQVHGLLDELQVLRLLLVAGELLEYSAQHPVWIQGVPGGYHSPEQPRTAPPGTRRGRSSPPCPH